MTSVYRQIGIGCERVFRHIHRHFADTSNSTSSFFEFRLRIGLQSGK
jgi:hypothetical protein